jgi:hypothetical protein
MSSRIEARDTDRHSTMHKAAPHISTQISAVDSLRLSGIKPRTLDLHSNSGCHQHN